MKYIISQHLIYAGVKTKAVEPESKNFRWWSWSLKFGFPFNRNVGQAIFTNNLNGVLFSTDQIVLEPKTFQGWSRSQIIQMPGARVGSQNLSADSTALVKTQLHKFIQWFSVFTGLSHFGAGAKYFWMLELEPKNLEAWGQSLKFEFRFHSPG